MVYVTDLSPTQAQFSDASVKDQVDDLEQPRTFRQNHFDLIHTGTMLCSIRDWPLFLSKSLTQLRPGGYIECHELKVDARTDGNSLPENSTIKAWCPKQEEAMRKAASRITGENLKAQMGEARFVDVATREARAFQLVPMLEGLEGLTMGVVDEAFGVGRG
ncbi:MAG: hypothetical protein Q9208_006059 [Pyrenodesmia sp. 3 TL-2023]